MTLVRADTESQPNFDLPSLALRWDGLVVTIDANTVNVILHRATAGIPEIEDIGIEPEDGELRVHVIVRKGVRVPLKGLVTTPRLKDGFLGFHIEKMKAFGFISLGFVIKRVVERYPGRAFYYPDEGIVVVDLNPVLPPELFIDVRDVQFENGEIKVYFGPSQYRLDKIIENIGKDPFEE